MKRYLLLGTTILILLAKYLQIFMLWTSIPEGNFIVLLLTFISLFLLIFLAIKSLDSNWKSAVIFMSLLSIISISVWISYPIPWINLLWSFLAFTSIFLAFYSLSHYEIKKFPAFSYAFSLIYILTESMSIWRGDIDALFFIIYLTLIIPMYIVGIWKIREE